MIFQETVGIDIQTEHFKLIYLKGSFKGINAVAHASYEFDKGKSPTEKVRFVADAYRDFAVGNKIGAPDIYVGLARELFLIRTLTFPLSVKENIAQTLRYEMEKYVPIPLDALHYDFIVGGESKIDNVIRVLLLAAKKEHLEPYFELSRLVNPGIAGIEPTPIARMNAVNYLMRHDGEKNRALVHLDEDALEIDCTSNGITQGWHGVAGPFDDQEHLAERIGRELKAVLRTAGHEAGRMDVLFDGPVDVEGLVRASQTEPGFHIRPLKTEESPIPAVGFAGAFGLALKGHTRVAMVVNLLPVPARRKKSKAGYFLMLGLGVLLGLSVAGLLASKVVHQRMILERLQTELTYLQSGVRQVDGLDAEIGDVEKRIVFLDGIVNSHMPVDDVLHELTTRIPESAWIKTLDLSGTSVRLMGDAQSASGLLGLLEASPLFRDARFLSTITKTGEGRESFQIGLTLVTPPR